MRNHVIGLCALAIALTLGLGASPASADIFDQQPSAGSLTDGVWATKVTRDGEQYILAMRFLTNGNFVLATFKGKQMVAKQGGAYRAENGRLRIKLSNGQTGTYQYNIDGNRLTLVSATSKAIFQRVRRKSSKQPQAKRAATQEQLQGTWMLKGTGGRIITKIKGNRIELTVINNEGKVIAHLAGTYTIQGDKLMVRTDSGEKGAILYRLQGNRLTLVIDGKTFTMTRTKAGPKKKGVDGFPGIA